MPADEWPDHDAPYEFPGTDKANRQPWQGAIDAALEARTLELTPTYANVYNLRGRCPRCGHQMAQSIDFSAILPKSFAFDHMLGGATTPGAGTFNVVCSCIEPHPGQDAGANGCGWGRGLKVSLTMPAAGRPLAH